MQRVGKSLAAARQATRSLHGMAARGAAAADATGSFRGLVRGAPASACFPPAALRPSRLCPAGAGGLPGDSSVRWFAGKGKAKQAKKGKGAPPTTAGARLHKTLLKEIDYLHDETAALPPPTLPARWSRVDVDDFVSRGEEGIIVVRKNFVDHRVDVVASTQLIEIESESDEVDEDEPTETESAAVLVVLTKLGKGKPLFLECLANAQNGLTTIRMSVGIDNAVYLSSVYGPATSLYLTYSALWENEIANAGIENGANRTIDEGELQLWNAAKEELEEDTSSASWGEIYELDPAFQESLHDLLDARIEPALIDYLLLELERQQHAQYVAFLKSSLDWVQSD
jgi:hypothetical protein